MKDTVDGEIDGVTSRPWYVYVGDDKNTKRLIIGTNMHQRKKEDKIGERQTGRNRAINIKI